MATFRVYYWKVDEVYVDVEAPDLETAIAKADDREQEWEEPSETPGFIREVKAYRLYARGKKKLLFWNERHLGPRPKGDPSKT